MAKDVSCDYCGEHIEGRPVEVWIVGKRDEGEFQYHRHEGCWQEVNNVLRDMRAFAIEGEGSGLVWRLVSTGVQTDPAGESPVGEEWSNRVDAGTPLYKLDLCAPASRGLREANLVTLEEVAGRTEEEIRSIDGVGPKSFRRLVAELERLGLTFRDTVVEGVAS